MTHDADLSRLIRRHAETSRLLGVDFLPIGRSRAGSPYEPAPPADSPAAGVAGAGIEDKPALARSVRDAAGAATRRAAKLKALEALRERYAAESTVARAMPGWTNIVFGDGDPDARLMFVGEAPGADEDRTGVPFVGRAGQKLNEMIKAMGLSRESVYIANILKVRPPDNRTPTPDEAAQDGPFLAEQIAIIQPEVIVTLGKPATQYLLDSTDAMGALRGRWSAYRGIPVMPTFHPAFLLRQYTEENRRKVWSDLKQVITRLAEPR